ncbi:MAG: hypothetical protein GKR94_27430 [Gammaproteobacteria bacterium]|nr:hypothetical protein [Gammaproteobacteria bacterium]
MKRKHAVPTPPPQRGDNETQLRVRLPEPLHKDFLAICREQDQNASQVIRAYIREYVRKNA